MKLTKRMAAALLTLLLVAAMLAVPSMTAGATGTYEPVHVDLSALVLTETLSVTYPGRDSPGVKYTLTLGEAEDYYDEESVAYPPSNATLTALRALKTKTLATVEFVEGAASDDSPATENYVLDPTTLAAIHAVNFDSPCIVFLPITKSITSNVPDEDPDPQLSNNVENTALVITVQDNDGVLTQPSFVFVKMDKLQDEEDETVVYNIPTTDKVSEFEDEYPNTLTLTLEKQVTGNMGKKDQYFLFVVTLSWPESSGDVYDGIELQPKGANSVANATANYPGEDFDENHDNLAKQAIVYDYSGSEVTFSFWLKHGEKITIPNIPYDVTYSILENEESYGEYTVSYTIDGEAKKDDDADDIIDSQTISGEGDDVVFTNELSTTPPTGLSLQTAAPIAGVVIALGLGAVLVLSRKRRENGQDA